jgi:hypothetical protein
VFAFLHAREALAGAFDRLTDAVELHAVHLAGVIEAAEQHFAIDDVNAVGIHIATALHER